MKMSNLKFATLVITLMFLMSFQGGGDTVNRIQQPQTVTLTLSVEHAEIVMKGLIKLPYEESAAVIATIQQQASRQLQAPPVTAPKQDTTTKKN